MLRGQQLCQFRHRHRGGEQVPLGASTAEGEQVLLLLPSLHPLGCHPESERRAERDEGRYDRFILRVAVEMLNK